jgi:transcriptional regulator with PAS, ATPase and Fis domain
VILETTHQIEARSLPDFHLENRLRKSELPALTTSQSIDDLMSNFERELILQTLDQNLYNLTKTAEQLKISRHALRYRMQRLNIHLGADAEEETTQHSGKEPSPC